MPRPPIPKKAPGTPQARAPQTYTRLAETTYRAGCDRTWAVASAEADLAYTDQAFPECPTCPHRVEPEGGPPFCTLRPVGTAHPFAMLADLNLGD